jgi:hypothetical protein
VCDADVLLYFPFDEDLHDHSCQRAISQQTSEASVVLAEDAERGTVAFFNGASSLHVGFIYNYFADRTVTAWSVSVWFKRTGGTDLLSGLVNNGDCVGSPSFGMHLGDGQIGAVNVDTDVSAAMVTIDGVQVRISIGGLIRAARVAPSFYSHLPAGDARVLAAHGSCLRRLCSKHVLGWCRSQLCGCFR